jgi:hypothetical protein
VPDDRCHVASPLSLFARRSIEELRMSGCGVRSVDLALVGIVLTDRRRLGSLSRAAPKP